MPNSPQIGKTEYRQLITQGRNAARTMRQALGRLPDAGEMTRLALLGKTNNALAELLEVLDELDQIGQTARNIK